jgi:hypothetical protein
MIDKVEKETACGQRVDPSFAEMLVQQVTSGGAGVILDLLLHGSHQLQLNLSGEACWYKWPGLDRSQGFIGSAAEAIRQQVRFEIAWCTAQGMKKGIFKGERERAGLWKRLCSTVMAHFNTANYDVPPAPGTAIVLPQFPDNIKAQLLVCLGYLYFMDQ